MKIVADAQSLKNDLAVVSRAVSPRSTLPVLANVLFYCENGSSYLAATNLEMAITKAAKVEVIEPGKVTLLNSVLSELLGSLSGEITITVNEKTQKATLKSKSGSHTIPGINANEFPPIAIDGTGATGRIETDSEKFLNTLKTVVFCASTDEARPILTGVLVEVSQNMVTFQAADGFRLAMNCYALETPVDKKIKTVIPANALNELTKIAHGKMTVYFDPNKILFVGDDWSLTAQRIEGSFPDLSQVIPTKHKTRVFVDSSQFKEALKRCKIYNNLVQLEFSKDPESNQDKLIFKSQSEELGETGEDMPVSIDEGDPIVIGFNTSFLLEMLNVINGELIVDLTESVSPGKFSFASQENWLHCVMPMHIKD